MKMTELTEAQRRTVKLLLCGGDGTILNHMQRIDELNIAPFKASYRGPMADQIIDAFCLQGRSLGELFAYARRFEPQIVEKCESIFRRNECTTTRLSIERD